jgi:D-alanyl-lipoteichoic acid acyltransferase DltB (MBOAT superfamily)
MLVGLLAAVAAAPLFWLAVPVAWRREAVTLASLAALTAYDPRLLPFLLVFTAALFAWQRATAATPPARHVLTALGLLLLVALFVWNKHAGTRLSVLPSQTGVVLLGVSFLVLKAAGSLIDAARGTTRPATLPELLAWIVFLPTYPSGPIEDLDHFRAQQPTFVPARALAGLERILVGLVKALVVAHLIGEWVDPLVATPERYHPALLLFGLYGFALRFYFDLAGYSDIAIGLSALYGWDIQENFDRPFARRNLVQLWQHWHITLTGWLRIYVFVPVTRALMRRRLVGGDRLAIAAGQLLTMLLIGLWHGLTWNFAVFGLLHGVALTWVAVLARDAGRRLPPAVVRWWRTSPAGYVVSVALTFNFFALSTIFVITDVSGALRYLGRLIAR